MTATPAATLGVIDHLPLRTDGFVAPMPVRDADGGRLMLGTLRRLPVARIAVAAVLEASAPVRPLALGLAVKLRDGAHPACFVVDLRSAGASAFVAAVLRVPVRFIAHDLAPVALVAKLVGAPVPRDAFSTRLAARMLDLGRFNAHYEIRRPGETDVAVDQRAGERRAEAESLPSLALRHGVALPPHLKDIVGRLRSAGSLSDVDVTSIAAEAAGVLALYEPLTAALRAVGLEGAAEQVEMPASRQLAELEATGVTVDRVRIRAARAAAQVTVDRCNRVLVGFGFRRRPGLGGMVDIDDSYDEKVRVLRASGGLRLLRMRGSSGRLSFSLDVLDEVRHLDPVIEQLYLRTRYVRLLSDPLFLETCIGRDGRVFPSIDPLGADTGRISFHAPNLPGMGRIMRPVVVPDDPEYGLIELDYSAEEPLIAGALFDDPALLSDCNGGDPYDAMARALRASGGAAMTRDGAKVMFLATVYGMRDETLALRAGFGFDEARELRARLLSRYPGLARGIRLAEDQLLARGYAEVISGLKRFRGCAGALSPWERRWAFNTLVQGAGAVVLKHLLPRLGVALAGMDGRLVLPVHDAVLVQVPRARVAEGAETARRLMEESMQHWFPSAKPKVVVNAIDPSCWNKNGRSDSIDRLAEDPNFRP